MCKKSARLGQLFFSLFAVTFTTAFFSCSNIQQGKRAEDDEQTLRELTAEMAADVLWTGELEADRLTATISSKEGIARGVALSPLSVIAGGEEHDVVPVYPFLADFGSLDTTLITPEVRDVLTSFCDAINKAQNADSYMASGCLYQLALFYEDMQLVKPEENADAPTAESADSSSAKSDGSSAKTDDSPAKSDSDALSAEKADENSFTFYDSYFYGQPYVTGTMYEIPVRFTGKERSADILIFLTKERNEWKIDELQILKAEQKNGGK